MPHRQEEGSGEGRRFVGGCYLYKRGREGLGTDGSPVHILTRPALGVFEGLVLLQRGGGIWRPRG